jgi:hypothetical protein
MASRQHRHKTDIAPLHCRASAQTIIPPRGSPLPPPLPEPKIAPPVVAKMDAPLQQNYAPLSTRPWFSDRITSCLQTGAAAGLGPSDRETLVPATARRIRDPAPTDKHLNSQFLN